MPDLRFSRWLLVCWTLTWLVPAVADDGIDFFESKIRPVLVRECYECHAANSQQVHGGLLLDHQAGLLRGGDSGPAVVASDVDRSLLIGALRHEDFEMPPKGRLDDSIINDFVRWIEIGAPDPRTEETKKTETTSQAMSLADAKQFWAFQSIARPELPIVQRTDWAIGNIDLFVLSKLEAAKLQPVGPATKRQWIRRATFDLIGLPPTVEEIDAFLADESSSAYETVIDRLLQSPHYGERWGRHWLDVARYAEDQAHTFAVKPSDSGYRYRDWVVESLNDDMPYDQFIRLQIAADLMDLDQAERFRHLPALGFFGLGAQYYKNSDAEKARADELDDRVDTLTRGFLGLTVSCARCHDHKYDPIPTQDYYSLAGVFQSCRLDDKPLVPDADVKAFEAAQASLKTAEEAVKTFVATEKQAASEAQAGRVAEYLMTAWRYQAIMGRDDAPTIQRLAADNDLSEIVLKRWVDFLIDKKRREVASLAPWLAAADGPSDAAKAAEHEQDLIAIAQSIQRQLLIALDIRAGRSTQRESDAKSAEPKTWEPGKPRYGSPMVTKPVGLVDVDVDLAGAKEIYLVITDAGDGKSCDHADWIEPRFMTADGEQKLTSLKWKSAQSGVGNVRVNKNFSGQPLRVNGLKYNDGFGAHAPSVIVFDIPPGVTRFKARVGLDNSGTDQPGCGDQASVQFRVYTERPNDFDRIVAGQVKPDQGVLSKEQADLISLAFSEKGIFAIDEAQLDQVLPGEKRDQWLRLREKLKLAKESLGPKYPVAHGIAEAKADDMQVFIRGNPARRGEVAPRRFLSVLAGEDRQPFTNGSGRMELAQAIASDQNPLTARVMVNRVWQNHFGRGLVATPSNFGALGERPSHPELLDYLAQRFIDLGWSVKSLHREIMLSATYRLSSDDDARNAEIDGDNRLLWRMNRRRLDVEAWRDALLAVSNRLDRTLRGPSTDLDSSDNVRRTVYAKISRHDLNGLLRLFDFPDANITSERRGETTVPQQQLYVLNSRFMIQQSQALAATIFESPDQTIGEQIRQAFLVLYGREATDAEVRIGQLFLQQAPDDREHSLSRAARYAQVLLAANEFTFID